MESVVNICTEMPASEQLKEVNITNVHQTEYKIIDLNPDTTYIVYLRAATTDKGERTFVEDSTTALGGLLLSCLPLTYRWSCSAELCSYTLNVS